VVIKTRAVMTCRVCLETAESYWRNSLVCKRCYNAQALARRKAKMAEDPAYAERIRASNRASGKRRWDRDPELRDRLRAANRARSKANARKYTAARYGMSLEEWNAMFAAQGNACAICQRTAPGGQGWNTDHCHTSGRVRGILCCACNRGIGNLQDSAEILERAAAYLRRHR
jgi:hypothetical protein